MTELARALLELAGEPLARCELPENMSHAIAELEDADLFRLLVVLDATIRSNGTAIGLVQRELRQRRRPLPPLTGS